MMLKTIFGLAMATLLGAAAAGEVHGGINFEIQWTNTSSPLTEVIKDTYEMAYVSPTVPLFPPRRIIPNIIMQRCHT